MKYIISIIGLTLSCSLLAASAEGVSGSKKITSYVLNDLGKLSIAQERITSPNRQDGYKNVELDLPRAPNVLIYDMEAPLEPHVYERPAIDQIPEVIACITCHPALQGFLRDFMHQFGFFDACRRQIKELGIFSEATNEGNQRRTFIKESENKIVFEECYRLPDMVYLMDQETGSMSEISSDDGSSLGTFTLNSEFSVDASGEIKKEIKHFYASTANPELFEALIANCDRLKTLGLKKVKSHPGSLGEVVADYQFGDLTRYLLGIPRPI